ncbi:MAG: undecaprenyl/decaprenyl-phosphate alpha-N-acetylglucosaminyl 1-phosphate transferase [Armatimonadetes bacterium]|nr:undecaprenyl/decaprenyl-phosphate alpha-N-acetylglucosaminyl 1-phosphate transferase [Armatimonadota bacterium]
MSDLMDWPTWIASAAAGSPLDGFRFPLLAAAVAMAISWGLTPVIRKFAIKQGAIDDPARDDRRVHKEPTPRWGGMAIYLGLLGSLAIVLPFAYPQRPFPTYLLAVLILGALITVNGALDDLYQFSAKIQALILLAVGIAVQFFFDPVGRVQIQGMVFPAGSQWTSFGWIAIPLTAFYIFIVTKTMDTIDGLDGLTAGIASISAATLSVIGTMSGQPRVALVAAAVAGASIGFLKHNYNPARIFMGTGGAQFLGFMLACMSIVGAMKTAAALAILVPIFVFGVPIFDAGFVILRRLLSGQPITQADKRHVHHTLMSQGLNQRQAVWILYAVAMVLCGTLLMVVKLRG